MSDKQALLEQIHDLLAATEGGEGRVSLARIEETLTSGYAEALAIEHERHRLRARLEEAASRIARGEAGAGSEELASLSRRMSQADGDLTRLRRLLASLRERARDLRAA